MIFISIADFSAQFCPEPTRKKNCAMLFICSGDITFSLGTALLSIEKHSPHTADNYIVFCSKGRITDSDLGALYKISEKLIFVEFTDQEILSHLKLKSVPKRWPLIMYSRLFFPILLQKFRHVLSLDTDILVYKDLTPIFQFAPLAWRVVTLNLKQRLTIPLEGVTDATPWPNAGVILISDHLENFTPEYLFNLASSHSYGNSPPDEAAMSLMAFYNNIPVTPLPFEFHSYVDSNLQGKEPYLVHSMDKLKFWNSNIFKLIFPEWGEYYRQWITLGGSENCTPLINYLNFPDNKRGACLYFAAMQRVISLYDKIKFSLPLGLIPSIEPQKGAFKLWIAGLRQEIYYELDCKNPGAVLLRIVYWYKNQVEKVTCLTFFGRLIEKLDPEFIVTTIEKHKILILERRISISQDPTGRFLSLVNSSLPNIRNNCSFSQVTHA